MMSKHASKPYNPSIANVYYLAGFIESWGRGIEKICQACDKDGSPRPEYTINPGDIMIKFTASEDRVIRIGPKRVTAKVTAKVTIKVTDKEADVLDLIREDPGYSMDEIAKRLSVSRKTVAARIKSLKEKGILERIGATKNGHWQINE